jgi:hypothetical protein
LIANSIEGGESGVSNGRGLFKREVGRLRQEVVLCGARIFGEGAFIVVDDRLVDVLELQDIG